jgi:hypothetical protein
LPSDDLRLHEEEIKSAVEYERETLGDKNKNHGKIPPKDLSIVREEEEFTFENSRDSNERSSTSSNNSAEQHAENIKSMSNEADVRA